MKVRDLYKIPLTLGALLMASSTAFAAMDRDSRVTELENQMKQVGTETAMGTFGANTASARADVDGRGWFITLDALFWKTKIGGTEYAYSDQDPRATLPIKGRTKSIEFDWDWGLRAGLGYNFAYDGWDTHLQYTWWDTSGSDSTRAGLNSSIIPMRGSSTIVQDPNTNVLEQFLFCASAKSQFDFSYQALDLELGRAYYVSSMLSLRPFWGVKSAWMDLEQITRYTGGGEFLDPDGVLIFGLGRNTVHIKEDSDFWGIGPRTGIDTKWYLGDGFSIFGNVAAALLFGFFEVHHKEKFSLLGTNRINLNANRHAFSPTVQAQIGLRYDTYFHKDQYHVGIGLGFEGQYWWRQNQMLKIDDAAVLKYERYSEDLAMYGLTLDFRLDF